MSEIEPGVFIAVVAVVVILTLFLFFYIRAGVLVVRHTEVVILERFGRYKTTLKPGLHWRWPLIETAREISWRYLDARVSAELWCLSAQSLTPSPRITLPTTEQQQ